MLTPFYALYVGIKTRKKAIAFFFGVEIPVIILTVLRIFMIRELTLGSAFLLLSGAIALGVFAWSLLETGDRDRPTSPALPYVITITHTLVLLVGLYVALLSMLYALPFAAEFIKGFFSFNWLKDFRYFNLFVFLIMGLFLLGSLAFIVFPFFISYFLSLIHI